MPHSKVRCETTRQNLQPEAVKNWDFPFTDHQTPNFEVEESWSGEKDCLRELLVGWKSYLSFQKEGGVLPFSPKVKREGL